MVLNSAKTEKKKMERQQKRRGLVFMNLTLYLKKYLESKIYILKKKKKKKGSRLAFKSLLYLRNSHTFHAKRTKNKYLISDQILSLLHICVSKQFSLSLCLSMYIMSVFVKWGVVVKACVGEREMG